MDISGRLEYKYWISESFLDDFRADILPYMNYDPFSLIRSDKQYTVRSNYLDTATLKCYHEKLDGVKIRNKFRIRGYNDPDLSPEVFLEIKRKNQNFISKDRVHFPYTDLLQLVQHWDPERIPAFDHPKSMEAADKFIFHYLSENLMPIALIVYEREAFLCKYGSRLRITFDKVVRTRRPESITDIYGEHNLMVCRPGFSIIEIKFYQVLPVWIPALITKYRLKREAISKYTMGVDTLHHQLPVHIGYY